MTNVADNKLLLDYYESKTALDMLTKEVADKRQAVLDLLLTQPDKKTSIGQVGFSLRTTPNYEFSSKIEAEEVIIKTKSEALKSQKKNEIATGVAKQVSESYAVVVKQPKF